MAGVVHRYSVCTVPAVVCAGVYPVASRVTLGTCMGGAKCQVWHCGCCYTSTTVWLWQVTWHMALMAILRTKDQRMASKQPIGRGQRAYETKRRINNEETVAEYIAARRQVKRIVKRKKRNK